MSRAHRRQDAGRGTRPNPGGPICKPHRARNERNGLDGGLGSAIGFLSNTCQADKSLGLFRQISVVFCGRRQARLRPSFSTIGATFAHGFAEDAIEWELSEDRQAENKAHNGRGGSAEAPGLNHMP